MCAAESRNGASKLKVEPLVAAGTRRQRAARGEGGQFKWFRLGCDSLRPLRRNLFTLFLQLWSHASSPNMFGCFVCLSCVWELTQAREAAMLCYKSLIKCSAVFPHPPCQPRLCSGCRGCLSLRGIISFEMWKQTWSFVHLNSLQTHMEPQITKKLVLLLS